jgi:EGF-like domain
MLQKKKKMRHVTPFIVVTLCITSIASIPLDRIPSLVGATGLTCGIETQDGYIDVSSLEVGSGGTDYVAQAGAYPWTCNVCAGMVGNPEQCSRGNFAALSGPMGCIPAWPASQGGFYVTGLQSGGSGGGVSITYTTGQTGDFRLDISCDSTATVPVFDSVAFGNGSPAYIGSMRSKQACLVYFISPSHSSVSCAPNPAQVNEKVTCMINAKDKLNQPTGSQSDLSDLAASIVDGDRTLTPSISYVSTGMFQFEFTPQTAAYDVVHTSWRQQPIANTSLTVQPPNVCFNVTACSSHGACIGHSYCKCQTGFGGAACSLSCPRVNGNLCNNHGTCVAADASCHCSVGWSGNDCANCTLAPSQCNPLPPGIPSNDSEPFLKKWAWVVSLIAGVLSCLVSSYKLYRWWKKHRPEYSSCGSAMKACCADCLIVTAFYLTCGRCCRAQKSKQAEMGSLFTSGGGSESDDDGDGRDHYVALPN